MGKHHKRKEEAPVEVDIDRLVTPFLDMAFQLMFFFVITFKPADVEGQMSINLPKTEETASAASTNQDISDTDTEKVEFKIRVTSAQGGIGSISASSVEPPQPLEAVGSRPQDLKEFLDKQRKSKTPEKNMIKIEAEKSLKYECLVQIMEACIAADFKGIGFTSPYEPGKGDGG